VHEAYYRTDTPEMGGNAMRPNCYCEYCRNSFREFIAGKYQELSRFNSLHQTAIPEWNELAFPLGPDPDPLLWLEWIDHHSRAIPEFLEGLITAARNEAPIFSTHECNDFYPGSWQTVLTGNDLWKMGETIDFGHEDMYPLEFDQQYQIYPFGMMKDMMRSVMGFDRPYTGNGQAFTPWVVQASLPANSMIEQVYTSLIHGISGLVWWLGNDLELWREMAEPNRILERWLPELAGWEPEQPAVALLYSYNTLTLDQNDWHPLDLQLIYMALRQLGIPVDFLSEQQVSEGILKHREYRLIILPGISALDLTVKAALLTYVEGGGNVLADYSGYSHTGTEAVFSWHIFGERLRFYQTSEGLNTQGEELFISVETPRPGKLVCESNGYNQVWAKYDTGEPAIVSRNYARGKWMDAGTLLGVDFANYPGHLHLNRMFPFLIRMNRDARNLLKRLCGECGITASVESARPEIELGIFCNPASSVWICLAVNHLPEPVETRLRIPGATRFMEGGCPVVVHSSATELIVEIKLAPLTGTWFKYE